MTAFRLHLHSGETILSEGEPGYYIYRVISGTVSIHKKIDGQEVCIAELQAGDLLGEMFLWHQKGLRNATAVAKTDVVLEAVIDREYRLQLLPLNPIQDELIVNLNRKLTETSHHNAQKMRELLDRKPPSAGRDPAMDSSSIFHD